MHVFKKTRFSKLSEYVRSLLLGKPVIVLYRDRSMDEILEEMVNLRQELAPCIVRRSAEQDFEMSKLIMDQMLLGQRRKEDQKGLTTAHLI